MSGEVLSYCPLQDGAEINRACSCSSFLKHAGPGSATQLHWNPLILVENLTASLRSQEGLVLCLKILKKTPLSPLPTHVKTHQQLRGMMHNDQLKDYNEFSGCLPPAATYVGFDYNGLPGLFSLQQVAGSGLCFNHPVIELVRQ